MTKLIKCYFWGSGAYADLMQLSLGEVVQKRDEYRKTAKMVLDATGVDHVVYYRDERNDDGTITDAHFYTILKVYNADSFCEMVQPYKSGLVGAVHKHELMEASK